MHMRRFCRARARTQEKHWRFESRYARPDQEHTWSGGEELIAVRLDLRAHNFCRTLDARARRAAHGTNIKCLASIDLTRPNKCNHRDGDNQDSRECTVKSAGHQSPIGLQ